MKAEIEAILDKFFLLVTMGFMQSYVCLSVSHRGYNNETARVGVVVTYFVNRMY